MPRTQPAIGFACGGRHRRLTSSCACATGACSTAWKRIEGIRAVKAHLNRIVGRLPAEGSVVITRNGRPGAVLMPVTEDTDLEATPSGRDGEFPSAPATDAERVAGETTARVSGNNPRRGQPPPQPAARRRWQEARVGTQTPRRRHRLRRHRSTSTGVCDVLPLPAPRVSPGASCTPVDEDAALQKLKAQGEFPYPGTRETYVGKLLTAPATPAAASP